jgi:Cu2+-exporting ATPase
VPISGTLRGVALRTATESTLERIAALARALAARPSTLLAIADRFASAVTPVAALVAVAAVIWGTVHGSLADGVVRGLAVLLVACPCGYAIAAPLVHWLAMRRAFRAGAVIRGADTIEALARVRAVAFDKTGTLTDPARAVVTVDHAPGVDKDLVRRLVRALEADSRHPVARALRDWAKEGPEAAIRARRFEPGRGVRAIGKDDRPLSLGREGSDAVVLRRGGDVLARFFVDEFIRPEAEDAVSTLSRMGIEARILSGDGCPRVARVGAVLALRMEAGLDAGSKVDAIARWRPDVAMVGDGVNDAPALAGSSASFSMDGATDLARGLAGVALLVPDLRLVPWTIALSRRAVRRVRGLFVASTAYNVVFVALAAAGALRPVLAGVSMLASSLLTLAFAARDLAPEPETWTAPLVLAQEAA